MEVMIGNLLVARQMKAIQFDLPCADNPIAMQEGWLGGEYLILFSKEERQTISDSYEIGSMLPGYELIGLRGWDDFFVRDGEGAIFSVPTLPCVPDGLKPFSPPADAANLLADQRYTGKIKWYVKPLIFGGDPALGENITWVTHDMHAKLVKWWNAHYRELSRKY